MTLATKEQIDRLLNIGLRDQWYVIAKSNQVQQGKPFATKALGVSLVLWRDRAGKLKCIEDYCPHRGAPLSKGLVQGNAIACAYHGVHVDGDGVVVKVPALPGCKLEGNKKLQSFAVEEHRDGIFAFIPSSPEVSPPPLRLPYELEGDDYAVFLMTSRWETNYRYALENLADPMHAPWLHGDTFTLSEGSRDDTVKVTTVEDGFTVSRVKEEGKNVDWVELIIENGTPHCRVNVPYPRAGGPGGVMRIVNFVTPIDEHACRIFFWRTRKVSGLQREAWRFLFRTTFEARHWAVLEQDREILAGMPDDARHRESLYQHDIGVTRLRQILSKMARAELGPTGVELTDARTE